MNTRALLRILALSVASIALCAIPQSAFARGGRGGGGGFHGGGFGGFHGGGGASFRGGFGGFRGGFNGFRGGYGGFRSPGFYGGRGGYWGYPRWGWGLNIGLGWGYWGYPYWYSPYAEPYAYAYPYSPYYYGYDDPCYYRDYCDSPDDRYPGDRYPDDRYPDNRRNNPPPRNSQPNSAPAKPSAGPAPQGVPQEDVTTRFVDYRNNSANRGTAQGALRLATYHARPLPENLRPAVRNVIQALRAMPPAARDRQLNSGRYASFSSQERELISQLAQTQ